MRVFLTLMVLLLATPAFSQVTVISGSGIKPEAGSKPKKIHSKKRVKKKKRRVVKVRVGKSFTIKTLQNINSKLTPLGTSVYFQSLVSVPGLPKGTLIRGQMAGTQIGKNKKAVVIDLKEAIRGGRLISMGGKIESLPVKRGRHATIFLGESFTAKTVKNTLRGKSALYRKKYYRGRLLKETAFVELMGGKIKVDMSRAKAKGFAYILLEPSKGKGLKIFNEDTPLLVTHIGKRRLPVPVSSNGIVKIGDRNKNGVMDYRYSYAKWDLYQYLPSGSSMITVQGRLKGGKRFEAKLNVKAE